MYLFICFEKTELRPKLNNVFRMLKAISISENKFLINDYLIRMLNLTPNCIWRIVAHCCRLIVSLGYINQLAVI